MTKANEGEGRTSMSECKHENTKSIEYGFSWCKDCGALTSGDETYWRKPKNQLRELDYVDAGNFFMSELGMDNSEANELTEKFISHFAFPSLESLLGCLPEKINKCPHQDVNPNQLCYRCIDVNDIIDDVIAALKEKMK